MPLENKSAEIRDTPRLREARVDHDVEALTTEELRALLREIEQLICNKK